MNPINYWYQKYLSLKAEMDKLKAEAVEGYVNYYEDSGGILMAEAQVGCPYHFGDKVRIIVIPNTDKK